MCGQCGCEGPDEATALQIVSCRYLITYGNAFAARRRFKAEIALIVDAPRIRIETRQPHRVAQRRPPETGLVMDQLAVVDIVKSGHAVQMIEETGFGHREHAVGQKGFVLAVLPIAAPPDDAAVVIHIRRFAHLNLGMDRHPYLGMRPLKRGQFGKEPQLHEIGIPHKADLPGLDAADCIQAV